MAKPAGGIAPPVMIGVVTWRRLVIAPGAAALPIGAVVELAADEATRLLAAGIVGLPGQVAPALAPARGFVCGAGPVAVYAVADV